jgi:hypothetical protein
MMPCLLVCMLASAELPTPAWAVELPSQLPVLVPKTTHSCPLCPPDCSCGCQQGGPCRCRQQPMEPVRQSVSRVYPAAPQVAPVAPTIVLPPASLPLGYVRPTAPVAAPRVLAWPSSPAPARPAIGLGATIGANVNMGFRPAFATGFAAGRAACST